MRPGYFYANIDLSELEIPVSGKPFHVPCGCPHCGRVQKVLVMRTAAFIKGRLSQCTEKGCSQYFLLDIEKATAEIPDDLLASHSEEFNLPDLDFSHNDKAA